MKLRTAHIRSVFLLQLVLALGFALTKPCAGGTIYSNLGPNNAFIVNREYETNFAFMATNFIATNGGILASITTPVFSLSSPANFGLYTDANGVPGTQLESWSETVPGFPAELVTLPSVLNPLLTSGAKYWIVIAISQAQKNNLAWYENNQGVIGGIWLGNSIHGMIEVTPAQPIPAIELSSIEPTCQSTYTSGQGPGFFQFCVTANGNIVEFQNPAGIDHFASHGEGYGICDATLLKGYADYGDGGGYGSWSSPTLIQPNGANTFPLEIVRTTSDGVFTLTQSFSRLAADRSVRIAMTVQNNASVSKRIFLLRYGNVAANTTVPDANYFDVTNAGGSAWVYDRVNNGFMLSASPTITSHLGLVFNTNSGPDPCNFGASTVSPTVNPNPFPYHGPASVGTVHSVTLSAGKSTTVNVSYRPF